MEHFFRDRIDAGQQLADKLKKYDKAEAIIYVLPRGGVIVGAEVSRMLGIPMDLIITRKIGHPYSPEFAIGAITEEEDPLLDRATTESLDPYWLRDEIENQRLEIRRRRELYLGDQRRLDPEGKICIIIDDGLATGLTMLSAIRWLVKRLPQKIVVAVPVAPPDTAQKVREQVDEFISLLAPDYFPGVGYYYDNFEQVTDEEVTKAAKRSES